MSHLLNILIIHNLEHFHSKVVLTNNQQNDSNSVLSTNYLV